MRRFGIQGAAYVFTFMGFSALSGGCANTAPCLAYTTTTQPKVISMRGYGSVLVEEEVRMCTHRYEPIVSATTVHHAPAQQARDTP